jgi:hypothetical protein
MNDCLIVATNIDKGYIMHGHRAQDAITGLVTKDTEEFDTISLDEEDRPGSAFGKFKFWACNNADAQKYAESIAKQHIGVDIKIFNLAEIISILPGTLVKKKVTVDGVLPE